jgi:hypothetical protein
MFSQFTEIVAITIEALLPELVAIAYLTVFVPLFIHWWHGLVIRYRLLWILSFLVPALVYFLTWMYLTLYYDGMVTRVSGLVLIQCAVFYMPFLYDSSSGFFR